MRAACVLLLNLTPHSGSRGCALGPQVGGASSDRGRLLQLACDWAAIGLRCRRRAPAPAPQPHAVNFTPTRPQVQLALQALEWPEGLPSPAELQAAAAAAAAPAPAPAGSGGGRGGAGSGGGRSGGSFAGARALGPTLSEERLELGSADGTTDDDDGSAIGSPLEPQLSASSSAAAAGPGALPPAAAGGALSRLLRGSRASIQRMRRPSGPGFAAGGGCSGLGQPQWAQRRTTSVESGGVLARPPARTPANANRRQA